QALFPAQVHDLAHHRSRGLRVLGVPGRGTVVHTARTFVTIALCPLGRGAPGDMEELSRPCGRPTVFDDQPSQPKSVFRSQSRVSVSHEGLLVEVGPRQLHSTSGRPSPIYDSPYPIAQRAWASQLAPRLCALLVGSGGP